METGTISLAEAVLGTEADAIIVADTDGIVQKIGQFSRSAESS